MRKAKLDERDVAISKRLREAREWIGVTQEVCAAQINIDRSTLANYEFCRTPLRYDVALRFCRQFVVSEEWLAIGKNESMRRESLLRRFDVSESLDRKVFTRQAMDLLSEPVCFQIPPGSTYSVAWEKFLKPRYGELVHTHFHNPRIVVNSADKPELGVNLFNAYLQRWMLVLSNEALRKKVDGWHVQRAFLRCLIEANTHIWARFIGLKGKGSNLAWLKAIIDDDALPMGPLFETAEARKGGAAVSTVIGSPS